MRLTRIKVSLPPNELELFWKVFKELDIDFKNIYLETMIETILQNEDKMDALYLLPEHVKTLKMLKDKKYKFEKDIKRKDRIVEV